MPAMYGCDKHRRGALALLVSTNGAMREPLGRGTGNRTGSTFFYVCADMKITCQLWSRLTQMFIKGRHENY